MKVATAADEARCPPTLNPSALGRMWLAWWMVHDDSHKTLRASADSNSRRAGLVAMAVLPGTVITANVTAPTSAKNLKFSRHTPANWDKLPIRITPARVYPSADA